VIILLFSPHLLSVPEPDDILNCMQRIPKSDPCATAGSQSGLIWRSATTNGKARALSTGAEPGDPSSSCPSTSIPQEPLQLSLGMLSGVIVGSAAVGALTAFFMLRP
jgi:hypothetical protein